MLRIRKFSKCGRLILRSQLPTQLRRFNSSKSFFPKPTLYSETNSNVSLNNPKAKFQRRQYELEYKLKKLVEVSQRTKLNDSHFQITLPSTEKLKQLQELIEASEIHEIYDSTLIMLLEKLDPSQVALVFNKLILKKYRFENTDTDDNIGLRYLKKLFRGTDFSLKAFLKCGLLNGNNSSSVSTNIADVFLFQYNNQMKEYTICKLISMKLYTAANLFLKIFKISIKEQERSQSVTPEYFNILENKYENLLCRLTLSLNKTPVLSEKNLRASIIPILHYSLNKREGSHSDSLTDYLLILNKFLQITNFQNDDDVKENNYIFLQYLSKTDNVNFQILASYLIKQFPGSLECLQNIGILSLGFYRNYQMTPTELEAKLLKPNIREELILKDDYPNMGTIALLYSIFLKSSPHLKRIDVKFLRTEYFKEVLKIQALEKQLSKDPKNSQKLKDLQHKHPFSTINHNTEIVHALITKSLAHKRPGRAIAIIKHFIQEIGFKDLHGPQLGYYLSKTISGLSYINLEDAAKMANYLTYHVKLDYKAFEGIIDSLLKISGKSWAKSYYDYVIGNERLVQQVINDLDKESNLIVNVAYKYNWDVPDFNKIEEENRNVCDGHIEQFEVLEEFDISKVVEFLDLLIEQKKIENEQLQEQEQVEDANKDEFLFEDQEEESEKEKV